MKKIHLIALISIFLPINTAFSEEMLSTGSEKSMLTTAELSSAISNVTTNYNFDVPPSGLSNNIEGSSFNNGFGIINVNMNTAPNANVQSNVAVSATVGGITYSSK